MEKKIIDKAIEFINPIFEGDASYWECAHWGIKILDKFYDNNNIGMSKKDIAYGIMLHDILNHGVTIEQIEDKFGGEVAMLLHNISGRKSDNGLEQYERLFKAHDYIFTKLIIRLSRIHNAINELNNKDFSLFISEHNDLRRKLHSRVDPDIMKLMDYEVNLIKYGRNMLSGKPTMKRIYENLVVDA